MQVGWKAKKTIKSDSVPQVSVNTLSLEIDHALVSRVHATRQ